MTPPRARLALLTTDIGRGHAAYLDGVARALSGALGGESLRVTSVFELAGGASRLAWHGARLAYQLAGRGGALGHLYGAARSRARYRASSLPVRLAGHGLRAWARAHDLVLVDHPLLVAALGDATEVWYQHGELCAPGESVTGARRVFVPTAEVAASLVRQGGIASRITVTGLCVEPPLAAIAEPAAARRRARLGGDVPLTAALFSSGAEPPRHVRALVLAAVSLGTRGHAALVFAKRGGRLERAAASAGLRSIPFTGRAELDEVTAARFPSFDLYVGPPHERSNWALGLGLPALLVGPDIGTFAPLNRSLLLQAGVAVELCAPRDAARVLEELRCTGELPRMLERGRQVPIDGCQRVALALLERHAWEGSRRQRTTPA